MAMAAGGLTATLGALVVIDPGTSLIVVAMLVGAELVVSGIYHLLSKAKSDVRSASTLSLATGVAAIVAGFILLTHVALTLLLIPLVVGALWITLGAVECASGARTIREGQTAWPLVTGLLGVVAGLVVIVWPVSSLITLTLLLGIWIFVRGITRMIFAANQRRQLR
jgi:uncharacterized membrane protein HdeD (DUF308 family)